jgi:predicted HD superfamily hydrolase involved in NAD metabolism
MRDRLPRERYRHCLSVARSAEKLAARHGAAAFKARVAGVLHDVARMWSADDLLTYASTHGLSVSENERAYPVLLHAPVGADIARREFGIDDVEILGAISRHTVAGPGMSGLEKIVYEADTFEPGRAFPGRARLEAAALRSLDEGLLACVAASIEYLEARRIPSAPETIALYDQLVKMNDRSS